MENIEQTILREIAALPKTRYADVLAFIRYLKLSIPEEEIEFEKSFERALRSIRARGKKLKISEEEIEAEIQAVRKEHAQK